MVNKPKYIRRYPSLPDYYEKNPLIDDIVDFIKMLNIEPDKAEALMRVIVYSAKSMRQGSGLLYSQVHDIVEYATGGKFDYCVHKTTEE